MNQLLPITAAEVQQVVAKIEEVIGASQYSRGSLILRHGTEDDVLPLIYDQFQARGCTVENVFSALLPNGSIYREIVFRLPLVPVVMIEPEGPNE